VLVTADGAWLASPPAITLRSTVGAGDASLAGYLLADLQGLDAPGRLREAVAYGAAAASLPGSTMPREADLHRDGVTITTITSIGTPIGTTEGTTEGTTTGTTTTSTIGTASGTSGGTSPGAPAALAETSTTQRTPPPAAG